MHSERAALVHVQVNVLPTPQLMAPHASPNIAAMQRATRAPPSAIPAPHDSPGAHVTDAIVAMSMQRPPPAAPSVPVPPASIVGEVASTTGVVASIGAVCPSVTAPGASVAKMVTSILKDKKYIVPVSAMLQGEYGLNDICFGVPAKLGAKGIEQIMEFKLNSDEKAMMDKSVELIRGSMSALKLKPRRRRLRRRY